MYLSGKIIGEVSKKINFNILVVSRMITGHAIRNASFVHAELGVLNSDRLFNSGFMY